jgi:hypothetical protein
MLKDEIEKNKYSIKIRRKKTILVDQAWPFKLMTWVMRSW